MLFWRQYLVTCFSLLNKDCVKTMTRRKGIQTLQLKRNFETFLFYEILCQLTFLSQDASYYCKNTDLTFSSKNPFNFPSRYTILLRNVHYIHDTCHML